MEENKSVVLVESTMLLPLVFVIVAVLFATLAQRMAREMAALPPLRAYTINLVGSLAGVGLFAVVSWLQLSPTWWFGVGFAAAVPPATRCLLLYLHPPPRRYSLSPTG